MEIIKVLTKKDLKDFILFPWAIYKSDPFWVPPLISEVESTLDRAKNPFWRHAEYELFLAQVNGKVVGRIAAIVDRLYLEKHNDGVGYFGFFESINDQDVAMALFEQAKAWLKERGIRVMRGPMSPSANDECGLLIDGFQSSPYIMMTHNPGYYVDLMERYGFKKAIDWVAYISPAPEKIPVAALDAADFARKKLPGIKIRGLNMKDLGNEKDRIMDIYNSAWENNWGFTSLTDEEAKAMVDRLKPIAVPELVLIAEVNGKPAGILALVPNYNEVLKKINGRLLPFGIFKLLYYSRKIKTLRLLIMGVKKEYRMAGVEALLYLEAMKRGIALGYKEYESSMVLETNMFVRKAAEMFGGRVYKTYRIVEIDI